MNKKQVLATGVGTYFILLVFAVIFFEERTVFIDSAYHLFHILAQDSFAIPSNRFPAVVTQIFPVAAMKLGLSLKVVAIMYSLSFLLFFTLTFLVTLLVIKNTRMALCILLFNILMVTHTFYWPHPELPAGVVFALFYLAWIERTFLKGKKTPLFWICSVLSLMMIAFFHPLLIFVFSFGLTFFFFSFPSERKFIVGIFIAYIVLHVLKTILLATPYDQGAMGGLSNIGKLFPWINMESNKNLILYVIHDYYFLPLLLFSIVLVYVRKKAIKKLLLVLVFFFGLCFIINLNYSNGADQFYLEAQYLILSIFLIIPFVYDILPRIKTKWVPLSLLVLIVAVGLVRIWNTHDVYTARLDWYRQLLAKTSTFPQKKLILAADQAPTKTLLMTWGCSYEIWLLSTLEEGTSVSFIIEEKKGEFDWAMNNNKTVITKWELFDYKNLNPQYFIFKDTTSYKHY